MRLAIDLADDGDFFGVWSAEAEREGLVSVDLR
jgi:hypothetical protein